MPSIERMLARRVPHLETAIRDLHKLTSVVIEDSINRQLSGSDKYQDSRRLTRYEYQVYSQNGEDGIIEEIFKRIETTNRFFVEFGAEDGLACNTTYLLAKNWTGYWLEANSASVRRIKEKFHTLIEARKLMIREAFITAENIETFLLDAQIPKEFDLLSIDIDGNDYWVWKAIAHYDPRVVVLEYNAMFRPGVKWVIKYDPEHTSDGTCYQGASLESLESLGRKKGYNLVGCNFTGVNCFFVREDLVGDKFLEPFSAENHYEPPRYHLIRDSGVKRSFGDFEVPD